MNKAPAPGIPPIGSLKYDLDTPCLVIDFDVFESNLRKMEAQVAASGKTLRPHAKTHKCSTISKRQLSGGAAGVCAAKLSEAEGLIAQGVTDILITGPVVTKSKLQRFAACLSAAPALTLVIDNLEAARCLNAVAAEQGLSANIILDIDVGQGRTGVLPDHALDMARRLTDLQALRLRGIQAYAGHAQHIMNYEARCQTGRDCLDRATEVLHVLEDNGIPCEVFTGGGTGTLETDLQHGELTEVQPGSYTLMDADYGQIGSAENPSMFETYKPALTLLSTVISANHAGHVTVDAGLKAVYQDGPAPVLVNQPIDWSYTWFGDEYGKILTPGEAPKVGEVLEMVVSHCDPTVNLYDYFIVTQAEKVIDIWPIDLRGKSH